MTGAPSPLISVIIPCYNLGAYLDEAIQSVLAQTVQDFEILVVDDGSTDEATRRLVASSPWQRTKSCRTENRGLARARNFLIERSRGEFLCGLDADNRLHPRYFEKTIAAFNRRPSLGFVSTRLQMFGEDDQISPYDSRCDLPMLLCHDPIFPAALVRRSAVVDLGGYDENMPAHGDQDWDLWIRLLEAGCTGVILPEILFYYRRRSGSLCDLCTRGETHLKLLEYLMRKHSASYRSHLLDVLRWKEARLAEERTANAGLESEMSLLEATLERKRAELRQSRSRVDRIRRQSSEPQQAAAVASLQAELEERRAEIEALRAEYSRSLSEVAALRGSASWKLTAPLRASYDLLRLPRRRNPE